MEIKEIIGLIIATTSLAALITLLFIILIPLGKIEEKERTKKTKMYDAITKYIELQTTTEKQKTEEQENENRNI